jgi:hypothetical protein
MVDFGSRHVSRRSLQAETEGRSIFATAGVVRYVEDLSASGGLQKCENAVPVQKISFLDGHQIVLEHHAIIHYKIFSVENVASLSFQTPDPRQGEQKPPCSVKISWQVRRSAQLILQDKRLGTQE